MAKRCKPSVVVQIWALWMILLASSGLAQTTALKPARILRPENPQTVDLLRDFLKLSPDLVTPELRKKIEEVGRLNNEMVRNWIAFQKPQPGTLPDIAALAKEQQALFAKWEPAYQSVLAEIASWDSTFRITVGESGATVQKQGRPQNVYAGIMFQPTLLVVSRGTDQPVKNVQQQYADLSRDRVVRLPAPSRDGASLYFLTVGGLSEGRNSVPIALTEARDRELARTEIQLNAKPSAKLRVRVVDPTTGQVTPVRTGVYVNGLFQFAPSAIPVYVFYDVPLFWTLGHSTWPSENKTVFYTDGEFTMSVPPGKCRIILQKGIEFVRVDDSFDVKAGETVERQYEMRRWMDLPKQGWYSADDHVHVPRDSRNNEHLSKWFQAEDVHVANIVQMGDIERLHFLQYSWSDPGMYQEGDYIMRTGQEDPRTDFRGHTIVINNTMTIHDRDTYYIYEDVADTANRQGGMYGYAHFGVAFNAERGLSISVPLRKADFLEVLQITLNVEVLYHFWDLGFKLIPTAGSDFPYHNNEPAGTARFYVHLDKPFSWANWFEALKQGHTFVSDGPILDFTVNGEINGSEVKLDKPGMVKIHALASLNPTIDKLSFLEIVQNGKVIRREEVKDESKESVGIDMDLDVQESCWVAAHAEGKNSRSHSAAIYITVAGKPFYNRAELSDRLRRANGKLDEVIQGSAQAENDPILKANAPRLRDLAEAARAIYSGMAKEAGVQLER